MLLLANTQGAPRAFSDLKLGKHNDIKRWLLCSSLLSRSLYRVGLLMLVRWISGKVIIFMKLTALNRYVGGEVGKWTRAGSSLYDLVKVLTRSTGPNGLAV